MKKDKRKDVYIPRVKKHIPFILFKTPLKEIDLSALSVLMMMMMDDDDDDDDDG